MDKVTPTTAGTVDRHDTTETFESTDPATGAVVGVFPVHGAGAVRETVERARPAAARWRALGYDGRKQRLAAHRGYLARRMHELADLVHRENGKPHADAILEITLAIDHLARAGNHARKVLGSRRVPAGMLAAGNAVVLKPAEHPATIGAWLAAAWRAAVPDAADASQVVTGFGGTGSSPCSWSSAARTR